MINVVCHYVFLVKSKLPRKRLTGKFDIIGKRKQTVKEIALIYVTSSRSEIKIDSYLNDKNMAFPYKPQ